MKKFMEWDKRFEKNHPVLHGALTAVCGVTMFAVAVLTALVFWAVL